MGRVVIEPEAQPDHAGFAAAELIQQHQQIVVQLFAGEPLLGGGHAVFEQVAQFGVHVTANAGVEGHRARHPHQGLAHHLFRELEFLGEILEGGGAAQAAGDVALGFFDAVELFGDVHRQANRAALGGDGTGDSLPDPPVGVGAEAEAAGGVVFLNAPLEAEGALLHQIEQLHAAVLVFLGNGHHQAQVGLDHALLGAASMQQLPLQVAGAHVEQFGPGLVARLHLGAQFARA